MLSKRRVHIEFAGKNSCTVTTPFKSKKIKINGPLILDLISFNLLEEEYNFGDIPFSFFVTFDIEETKSDTFAQALVMVQSSEYEVEEVGYASYLIKENLFSASVWTEN